MSWRSPCAALSLVVVILYSTASPAWACSSFMLHKGERLAYGHNLNEGDIGVPGMLFLNKRGAYKTGRTWSELFTKEGQGASTLRWIARYGSVSVNIFGRDLPDGGINEAGLFIWEMNEEGTYPNDPALPRLMHMNWMQYVLDNFATVDEALEHVGRIAIDGWPWHFFLADATGECAALAFVDGKPVVHRGAAMKVPGLFNTPYAREMELLGYFRGFGGQYEPTLDDPHVPRFVKTAVMVRDYDPAEIPLDYAMTMLERLQVFDVPEWSVAYDPNARRLSFRSRVNPALKTLQLTEQDFAPGTPVQILDIDQAEGGDARARLIPYDDAAMSAMIRTVTEMPGIPDAMITGGGLSRAEFIERFATHWRRAANPAEQSFVGTWSTTPESAAANEAFDGILTLRCAGEDAVASGLVSTKSGSLVDAPVAHLFLRGAELGFTFRTGEGAIIEARGVFEGDVLRVHLQGTETDFGEVVFARMGE